MTGLLIVAAVFVALCVVLWLTWPKDPHTPITVELPLEPEPVVIPEEHLAEIPVAKVIHAKLRKTIRKPKPKQK